MPHTRQQGQSGAPQEHGELPQDPGARGERTLRVHRPQLRRQGRAIHK